MLEIDGCHGEGGGQLVPTAVALAAITGSAVTIANVRAKRANPGLAAQHLTAVGAVAALCEAGVEGLELKSQRLVFRPRRLRGGDFRFDVGTAGSIPLVLQALLPAMIHSGERISVRIVGGTDVRAAPPLDYFRQVLLALIGKMGARVRCDVRRRGYYPRGGGEVVVAVESGPLHALRLDRSGKLETVHGIAHVANLPAHIADRMRGAAIAALRLTPAVITINQLFNRIRWDPAFGQGDFAIGYFDRMQRRIIVVPLRELTIDPADHFVFDVLDDCGESHHVPFHRVRQVFKNGELIWYRKDQ